MSIKAGKLFSLTAAFLTAMLLKVIKVYVPSTMQRLQTMPKAKVNLREMGRLRSQDMPVALSQWFVDFIGGIRHSLSAIVSGGEGKAARREHIDGSVPAP
jgi:hypothetical protein